MEISALSSINPIVANISYMVADLKYSQKHGLKICEVQHGSLSTLNGDLYVSSKENNENFKENIGDISPKIVDFFNQFDMKKWIVGSFFKPLKICFQISGWNTHRSIRTLTRDPDFLKYSKLIPNDPTCISSYHGIVYAMYDTLQDVNAYRVMYPGIIFIDQVTLNYWNDKYKMNLLFDDNIELKKYKADWKIYPRKYDLLLAERIRKEMPSDFYVIKPKSAFLSYGIIVVENKDLDDTLLVILDPQSKLSRTHNDKGYNYWYNLNSKNNVFETDKNDDTFIVEKYYESDYLPLPLPCKISNNSVSNDHEIYNYDATMRIAFILKYNNGIMTYHSMGGFWKLPLKALEETGTLNEKRISCCIPPFYNKVNPVLFEEINKKLEIAMLLLYENMIKLTL